MGTILISAKNALKILLDEAEARDYNPPANTLVIAELEYVIFNLTELIKEK